MQFNFSVQNLRFGVCKTILLACNGIYKALRNMHGRIAGEVAELSTVDSNLKSPIQSQRFLRIKSVILDLNQW